MITVNQYTRNIVDYKHKSGILVLLYSIVFYIPNAKLRYSRQSLLAKGDSDFGMN
jgi:hypothetical protein